MAASVADAVATVAPADVEMLSPDSKKPRSVVRPIRYWRDG